MKQYRYDRLMDVIKKYDVDIIDGTIRHKKTNHIQRGFKTKKGYTRVFFNTNGKQFQYGLHEVIAAVAGLNIVDKTVNHMNGDKNDNSFFNLEALTVKENLKHAWENGFYDSILKKR